MITTNWVYVKSEPSLWTVGFYDLNENFHSDNDYDNKEDAANRVHYLNGGNDKTKLEKAAPDLLEALHAYQDISYDTNDENYEEVSMAREMAVEAIKKAE